MVDITGLDKVELLRNLWLNMTPALFFSFSGMPVPEFDSKLASNAILTYIDYFCGRCIKTNLSHDFADPHLYDRDAGTGSFAKIVTKMRFK